MLFGATIWETFIYKYNTIPKLFMLLQLFYSDLRSGSTNA